MPNRTYWCNRCLRDVTDCEHRCPSCGVCGVEPDQRICPMCIAGLELRRDIEVGEAVQERRRAEEREGRYESLDRFYQADERRRRSGECDYGVHWADGRPSPRWRVSYVERTGEVYAVQLGGEGRVEVLGVVPPDQGRTYHRTLDTILAGWPDFCGRPGGLTWVRARLAGCRASRLGGA